MHKLRCGDEMVNSVRREQNHPGALYHAYNDGDGVCAQQKISPIYSAAESLAKVMRKVEVNSSGEANAEKLRRKPISGLKTMTVEMPVAHYNLGLMYRNNGDGVEKDLNKSQPSTAAVKAASNLHWQP